MEVLGLSLLWQARSSVRLDSDGKVAYYLTADDQGNPSHEPWDNWSFQPRRNWEQTTYIPPTSQQQMLRDIIHGETYNAPWPEDTWRTDLTKEGQDRWKAYLDIYGKLGGRRPNDARNGVTHHDIDHARDQVPLPLPDQYQYVLDHLHKEVDYQANVEKWFGENGHMDKLITWTTIDNLSLIDEVKNKLPEKPESQLKFFIGILISAIGIGLTSKEFHSIAAVLEGAWANYREYPGETDDSVRGTFGELTAKLRATFINLITQRERTRNAINGNWGRLKAFNTMIEDKSLVWPADNGGDSGEILREAARQFEIYVWQLATRAVWSYEGHGSLRTEYPHYTYNDIINEARRYVEIIQPGPFTFVLIAPGTYKKCGKISSGYFDDYSYVTKQQGFSELGDHLFDTLGVSRLDFYLGRNGWGFANNQLVN